MVVVPEFRPAKIPPFQLNRPQVDTRKLNPAPNRPLTEPDIATSCICRVRADALAGDQETRFGISPEAAYDRGESQLHRMRALARRKPFAIFLRAQVCQPSVNPIPNLPLCGRSCQRRAQCPEWIVQQRPFLLRGAFGIPLPAPSVLRPDSLWLWVGYSKTGPAAPPGSIGSCGCVARRCAQPACSSAPPTF